MLNKSRFFFSFLCLYTAFQFLKRRRTRRKQGGPRVICRRFSEICSSHAAFLGITSTEHQRKHRTAIKALRGNHANMISDSAFPWRGSLSRSRGKLTPLAALPSDAIQKRSKTGQGNPSTAPRLPINSDLLGLPSFYLGPRASRKCGRLIAHCPLRAGTVGKGTAEVTHAPALHFQVQLGKATEPVRRSDKTSQQRVAGGGNRHGIGSMREL